MSARPQRDGNGSVSNERLGPLREKRLLEKEREFDAMIARGDTRTASEKINHFIYTTEKGLELGTIPAYNIKTLGSMYELALKIKEKEIALAEKLYNIDGFRKLAMIICKAVKDHVPKDQWGKVVRQIEKSYGDSIVQDMCRGRYYDSETGARIRKPGDEGATQEHGDESVLSGAGDIR